MAPWTQELSGFRRQLLLIISLLSMLCLVWPASSFGEGNARMYRINKKEQQFRISTGDDAREPGCHNARFRKNVYRFAQAGFAWCSMYSEKNCAEESIVSAMWEGGKYRRVKFDESMPQAKMYPGAEWVLGLEADPVRSWYCEPAE